MSINAHGSHFPPCLMLSLLWATVSSFASAQRRNLPLKRRPMRETSRSPNVTGVPDEEAVPDERPEVHERPLLDLLGQQVVVRQRGAEMGLDAILAGDRQARVPELERRHLGRQPARQTVRRPRLE